MGTQSSKEKPAAPAVVNKPNQQIEVSSGFHVLEFHVPSAMSMIILLFFLAAAVAFGVCLYRPHRRHYERRARFDAAAYNRALQFVLPPGAIAQAPGARLQELDPEDPTESTTTFGIPLTGTRSSAGSMNRSRDNIP